MGASNNRFKLLAYILPQTKRVQKRNGILFFLLFLLAGFLIFVFFAVVIFFTLFSGFITTSTHQVESEQFEATQGFPAKGRKYLSIYEKAGKKYGIPWNILAAIHKVETDFGGDLAVSVVGAKGHTQFMDKSWVGWRYPGGTKWGDLENKVDITDPKLIAQYGGYGVDADGDGVANPYSAIDAIHSTANYLSQNHHEGFDWFDRGGPVWQYNHDYEHYVLKVKEYAQTYAHPVIARTPTAFLFPVEGGIVTSPFGRRFHPLKKRWLDHQGIDIGKRAGAPILAAGEGYVVTSRPSTGYGWKIIIDHGGGVESLYAHMEPQDVKVSVGEKITRGQVIAYVGNNGWSTGPHLHFEVHKNGQCIDPNVFLKSKNERNDPHVSLESSPQRK